VEIREVLNKLGVLAKEVLRKNDKAYKNLGLTDDEDEETLIGHMANHPGLLQRPIGVFGKKAVVARPAEELLSL